MKAYGVNKNRTMDNVQKYKNYRSPFFNVTAFSCDAERYFWAEIS
jgi:hypothetical protein